jgi:hypothetical protein
LSYISQTLFASFIFQIRSYIFFPGQVSDHNISTIAFCVPGIKKCTTMPGLSVEMEVLLTFCLGWPWILILLISASGGCGIRVVRYPSQPAMQWY